MNALIRNVETKGGGDKKEGFKVWQYNTQYGKSGRALSSWG